MWVMESCTGNTSVKKLGAVAAGRFVQGKNNWEMVYMNA